MRVYHTSYMTVEHPDVKHSREALDFGRGFYVTTLEEQAVQYAEKYRFRGKEAFLNVYELEEAWENADVKHFEHYDEEWLDFVAANRRGLETTSYEAVEGGIANDKVFRTLDLYFAGDIGKTDALKRLAYEKPNHQICLKSQELMDRCLHFIESKKL